MVDIEMIDKIQEWGFDVKTVQKGELYHEEAIKLCMFSEYLGDEFEKYLKYNDIELENWQPSDMEEFFEQYGIEIY